ncbi:hypothetical protein BWQ96_04689 [Gracilariopsis chorda]|uniref:Uncharacterized protein n=1 Tax=Gracilariopsis chorda TaxID=448386 RepID=A0A2V3ITU7_9FLOR|nr:hypothetical protein BWQ96_04689 [Gracilariopsis chorda]|eukprot:PXF45551.1 hypothetical protein BWQ96_04689 [Gracilariopsis chorda]
MDEYPDSMMFTSLIDGENVNILVDDLYQF